MPIRWDALLARHVALELHAALAEARLVAVRLDGVAGDLVLFFRERALLWRLHPGRGWLRLLPPSAPAVGDRPLKARLLGVAAPPDERIVRFRLAPEERGRGPLAVVVELVGGRWNALVTEGEPEVVRYLLRRRRGAGAHRVGAAYQPPAPRERRGVDGDVGLEEWENALGGLAEPERYAVLVRAFAWTSPLNARALLETVGGDGEPRGLALGHERWARLARAATAEPVLLQTATGAHPYPFPLPGVPHREAPSLLAAFETVADAPERAVPDRGGTPGTLDVEGGGPASAEVPAPTLLPTASPELLQGLEAAARRAARRVRRIERELARLKDPAALRRAGDLILARYREIPSGVPFARLTGFEGEPVDVELDPRAPAHASAARYYTRAAKSERARALLPRLLEKARADERRLVSLLGAARTGAPVDERLAEALVGPSAPRPVGAVSGRTLPYRVFRSSGGLEIRVGKGARHNDDLTFRYSAPGDVWLHARHAAGAHVVLRWSGQGRPPARDLEEAATLAALHSRARTSGTVPVDWTFRKYVRKPRGSPSGRVTAERVETLFVRPDPSLLERLAARG